MVLCFLLRKNDSNILVAVSQTGEMNDVLGKLTYKRNIDIDLEEGGYLPR